MEITTEELKKKIENGEKLIVDFHAKWCQPCRLMKPIFEKLAEEYRNQNSDVQLYTMDVELNQEFATTVGIRAVPTIKAFNKKEIVDTKMGMMAESQLRTIADTLING
jgi:thioredoxin